MLEEFTLAKPVKVQPDEASVGDGVALPHCCTVVVFIGVLAAYAWQAVSAVEWSPPEPHPDPPRKHIIYDGIIHETSINGNR